MLDVIAASNLNPLCVLIVDDEPDLCHVYSATLKRSGYEVICAEGVHEACELLTHHSNIACVVCDYRMQDGTGLEVVQFIQTHTPLTPISLITAFGNLEQSVHVLKEGAFDYVSKPVSVADLRRLVANMMLQYQATRTSVNLPINTIKNTNNTNNIDNKNIINDTITELPTVLGQSLVMKSLEQTIVQWAKTNACVVIQGETGTGKTLIAKTLHNYSMRASRPWVCFDASILEGQSLTQCLITLFGQQSSDVTLSTATHINNGVFQSAHGGTLFIKNIVSLSTDIQLHLLNALQDKSIKRYGAMHSEAIDIRLIVSTLTPLSQLVNTGQLRQDLYYRLNVMTLSVPPLRERQGDAVWLAQESLLKANVLYQSSIVLSNASITWLKSQSFLGNVRELHSMIERGIALCMAHGLNTIDIAHLQIDSINPTIQLKPNTNTNINKLEANNHLIEGQTPSFIGVERRKEVTFPMDLNAHLASIERRIIEQALQQARYNRHQAAHLLGLTVRQIRYRIEQLGIEG